jgi:hypothetical protein
MLRTIAVNEASGDDLILLRDALAHYANLQEQPSARLVALQREVDTALEHRQQQRLPKVFF